MLVIITIISRFRIIAVITAAGVIGMTIYNINTLSRLNSTINHSLLFGMILCEILYGIGLSFKDGEKSNTNDKVTYSTKAEPPTLVLNIDNQKGISNCPNCNAPITKDGRFCPYCGTKLPSIDDIKHSIKYVDEARLKELEIQKMREEHKLKLEEEKKRRELELEIKKRELKEEREMRRRAREDIKDFFVDLFEGLLEKIGYAILTVIIIGYLLYQYLVD